jgi:propionyl-CoA synthetase
MMSYKDVYEGWKADPEGFWMQAAEAVDWIEKPSRALDDSKAPFYRWFSDAVCNTCWNAVDRHVEAGRGAQAALIHDSPITGTKATITYAELQDRVARLAGGLAARGVAKGDRVIIYMPMVPEAAVAMLACARIGAVHSVVFGGFAANELAVRIDDATPKAIIAASCGLEPGRVVKYKPLLDAAIDQAAHKIDFCVMMQRPQEQASLVAGRDFEWEAFQDGVEPAECVPVGGEDPLYILYTSGTTGAPKGVVRSNAGHMVALIWVWRRSRRSLLGGVGCRLGGRAFLYRLRAASGRLHVDRLRGQAGGHTRCGHAFRAIKREDPAGEFVRKYDLSGFRTLFLAGERADPPTIEWAEAQLGVPVIDHWWQTETGWAIAGNPMGIEHMPVKLGSPTVAMPGYDIQILDDAGHPVPAGTLGAITVKLPLPPGNLPTLWQADERFVASYLNTFPGYYETGDAGMLDEDGYVYIMARTDDVINVAGHRLSTGAMEEVLAGHPDVAECAVIGVGDQLKGQLPMGFLCLNAGCNRPHEEIISECVKRVRNEIGPVAAFKLACVVDRLPKTRSGKILRGTMVKIADGEDYKMPATIDDPVILDEITAALARIGYPASS